MKTCRNCKHLQEKVITHDGREAWPCVHYRHAGVAKGADDIKVTMSEKIIDDEDQDCLNWTEKEPVDAEPAALDESETETSPVADEIEDIRLELESLRQFNEEVKRRNQEIENAKEESSRAGKWLKKLREDLEEYINNFRPKKSLNATDHPLLFSDKKEPESTAANDDWKNWPAKDHFDFTEKEWELMAPAEDVTEMTVGYLSDFCVRLDREKVKGFGETKRHKLEVQFMNFWTAHPKLCGTNSDDHEASEEDESEIITDDLFE